MVGAFAIAMLLLGRLIYRSRRDLSEIEDSLSRAEDSEAPHPGRSGYDN